MATLELGKSVVFQNVLLATDFSGASEAALTYAAAVAQVHDAHLYLVHVLPPEPRLAVPMDATPPDLDPDHRQAEESLERVGARAQLRNVHHTELLERGPIWYALSEVIREKRIDLLVLGTHGRTGLSKLVMGSAAEEMFRLAPCPVLTIGPHVKAEAATLDFRKILFASDFGAASLGSLPYAVDFANEKGGELTLLHVLTPLTVAEAGPYWFPDVTLVARQDHDKQVALRRLQALIPDSSSLRCAVHTRVEVRMLPDAIVDTAAELQSDLIVMGVKGSGVGVARTSAHMPWAIAHDVVCRAQCPVLTVRG